VKDQEVSMADEPSHQLNPAFRWVPWHIGDPAVWLETVLGQVEARQRAQIMTLYLDSVAAGLEANLKLVQGIRSIVAGAKK
jgi:hypothetical protein